MAKQISIIVGIVMASILSLGSVGILAWTSHYWANNNRIVVTTAYTDRFAYAPGETYFIEINYFTNEMRNGLQAFEVRLNYYTDVDTPTSDDPFKHVFASGIQFIGEPQFRRTLSAFARWGFLNLGTHSDERWHINSEHTFYNTQFVGADYEVSTEATFILQHQNNWIVDFGGKIGMIDTQGRQPWHHSSGLVRYHSVYDINHFLMSIIAPSRSVPNGRSVIKFDLSRWFQGRLYNEDTRRFDRHFDGDINNMFINVKVNRSPHGLVTSQQSMFGMVRTDRQFVYSPDRNPNDFWQSQSVWTLTSADFDFTNLIGNMYLGRLNQRATDFLSSFNDLQINININLDFVSLDGKVFHGFGVNPFRGLRVDRITITSQTPRNFHLQYAMPNVTTNNVTLIVAGGG